MLPVKILTTALGDDMTPPFLARLAQQVMKKMKLPIRNPVNHMRTLSPFASPRPCRGLVVRAVVALLPAGGAVSLFRAETARGAPARVLGGGPHAAGR